MGRICSFLNLRGKNISYSQIRRFSLAVNSIENVTRQKKWESVIGLEIHAQIASEGKLFSGAGTKFAAPVNTQVSLFDAALPGTLPVLNKKCVEAGVLTALALNCKLNLISKFDRKHYFYADLPAGYQITQQRQPLATGGWLQYPVVTRDNGNTPVLKKVNLTQLQLEQDSGKSLHDPSLNHSLIDLNRAGIGLMEIVTEPNFRSAAEATAFVKELHLLLQTLGTCNCNMSEGNLRIDASVSLRRPGDPLGTRAEVKNLNSIRFVGKAIEFEISRQIKLLDDGGSIANETRSFDIDTGQTVAMRDKEHVHDYRFLPEPNLPPLRLYTDQTMPHTDDPSQIININMMQRNMPELPGMRRERIQKQYSLTLEQAIILVNDSGTADYYEKMMQKDGRNSRMAINLLLNNLLAVLNDTDTDIRNCLISASQLGDVVDLLDDDVISKSTAKEVINKMYKGEIDNASEFVKKEGLVQIIDPKILSSVCTKVLKEHPKAVDDFRRGKKKSLKFLLGQAHKELRGKAEPKLLSQILIEQIEENV